MFPEKNGQLKLPKQTFDIEGLRNVCLKRNEKDTNHFVGANNPHFEANPFAVGVTCHACLRRFVEGQSPFLEPLTGKHAEHRPSESEVRGKSLDVGRRALMVSALSQLLASGPYSSPVLESFSPRMRNPFLSACKTPALPLHWGFLKHVAGSLDTGAQGAAFFKISRRCILGTLFLGEPTCCWFPPIYTPFFGTPLYLAVIWLF